MTFSQKFNFRPNMSKDERYARILDELGYELVVRYIPFTEDKINKTLIKHENDISSLDRLSETKWQRAAGYKIVHKSPMQTVYIPTDDPYTLRKLCTSKGITFIVADDLIGVLKLAAIKRAYQ